MGLVEHGWRKVYRVGVCVCLIFASLALPFLLMGLFVIKAEPNWGYTVVFIFLVNSIMWLLVAFWSLIKCKVISGKLERLKANGDKYELTIKRMVPISFVSFGANILAAVEGDYTDSNGNIKHIKSTNFVLTTFDKRNDFKATVYINPKNSKDFIVELFKK